MTSLFKYILSIIITIGCCFNTTANSADDILNKVASKFQQAKSVTADFKISGSGNASKGKIILSGDKFNIVMSDMLIWYDGRTQWTYSHSTNEVNITEPTPDELQQINPFAIINAFRKAYSAKLINNTTGISSIQLTPLSSHGEAISKIIISINNSTLFPSFIKLTLENKQDITISVTNVIIGKALPLSTFTFSEQNYPNAGIIDLR